MRRSTVLLLSLVGLGSCGPAGVAGSAITGKFLLDRADKVLSERMIQGGDIANGLIDQTATQLAILTEAARQASKDTLGKSLAEMNAQERTAFQQLKNATDQLETMKDAAYDIEQVTNIDVSNTIAMIPLVPHATYISSVRGLSVLNWVPTHQITVLATGLGPGRADQTTTLTFTVDGKQLVFDTADLSEPDRGIYTFRTSALLGTSPAGRITTRKVLITLSVTRPTLAGLRRETKQVKTPVFLSFYPQDAGQAIVSYSVPTFSYVSIGRKEQLFQTHDCGEKRCGDGGYFETPHTDPVVNGAIPNPPEGNRKVANPSISCGDPKWDPGGCGYAYDLTAKIDPTEREVDLRWRATASYVTMHVGYDVLEWTRGQPSPAQQTIPMLFDRVMTFCLPAGVDSGTITIKTRTGREYQTVVGAADLKGILSAYGRSTCAAGGWEYAYHVDAPH